MRDGGSTVLPMTDGIALGVVPDVRYREDAVLILPGDTLFLYTDGITEAVNADGEFFGLEGLQATFAAAPPKGSKVANDMVFEALHAFVGATPQADDITALALTRREMTP